MIPQDNLLKEVSINVKLKLCGYTPAIVCVSVCICIGMDVVCAYNNYVFCVAKVLYTISS